jgi:xanthine dehydrogenase accessory factor
LNGLLDARREKKAVALLRWLGDGREQLAAEGDDDPSWPPTLKTALSEALRWDKGRTIETDDGKIFVQTFNPPLRLIIVGAVHIAQALAPMAAFSGYEVVVVDPRRAFASDRRFPDVTVSQEWPDDALNELRPDARTAVVTLTHDPKLDDPALDVALRTDAFYIASLGSRKTHAARLERLGALGHDQETLGRIHGPAGLALGAVSPAEIAVSVLAEMTGVLRRTENA